MMATIKFSVKATSQQEWEDIYKWGSENRYKYFVYSLSNYSPSNNVIHFWSDEDMSTANDDGTYYTLTFEEFKNQYMDKDIKKETFEVDKEFILEAYKAACPTWKQRLENKFPKLIIKNPFADAKQGDRFKHRDGEIYLIARVGTTKYALIQLDNGNRYAESTPAISSLVEEDYWERFTKIEK